MNKPNHVPDPTLLTNMVGHQYGTFPSQSGTYTYSVDPSNSSHGTIVYGGSTNPGYGTIDNLYFFGPSSGNQTPSNVSLPPQPAFSWSPILQVRQRVFPMAFAGYDEGVQDRRALAGVGVADKEPVFLADAGRAYRIFDEVTRVYSMLVTQGLFSAKYTFYHFRPNDMSAELRTGSDVSICHASCLCRRRAIRRRGSLTTFGRANRLQPRPHPRTVFS